MFYSTIRGSMIRVTMASSHSGESPISAGRTGARGKFELGPMHREGVNPRLLEFYFDVTFKFN